MPESVDPYERSLMIRKLLGTPNYAPPINPHQSQKEMLKQFAIQALSQAPQGIGVSIPKGFGINPALPPHHGWPPRPVDAGLKTASEAFPSTRSGQGLEVPGNLNVRASTPSGGPPETLEEIIAGIRKDLGVPEGKNITQHFKEQQMGINIPENPTAEQLAQNPGVVNAKSPLGEVQPMSTAGITDPVMKAMMSFNRGKGNFGMGQFDRLPGEANLNPGPRHPNVGEPLSGPNRSEALKFQDAIDAQKLKKMGFDPDRMTPAERMRALFPGLEDLFGKD